MNDATVSVLIAEDEVLIGALIESTLADEGLDTTVALTGPDAVHILKQRAADFLVLVTDIRLGPGPNGWAVAHCARDENPDIGVIYITGDSMEDWRANGVPESVVIAKPFVPAQIVTAVMNLLNKPHAPQA